MQSLHVQLLTVMAKALQKAWPCKRAMALQKGCGPAKGLKCCCTLEIFQAVCLKEVVPV